MLAKTRTDKVNHLSKFNQFDAVGSNGIFGASPSIVKFAGFELRKTHTLKVKLINNSPAPQRLHILPPSTPFFKIKYHKKGMIPSGISEDIYVQFTPNDEYKYFYDSIRIHCEGDKILIPIHAFPVINSKRDSLLPPQIDMGTGCKVGLTYHKTVEIESNCPVSFEYEIKEVKPHPDIKVAPRQGDIVGNQCTEIQFTYTPSTYTTADAEFEIRTSEFDFKPQIVRVLGSAVPQRLDVSKFYNQNEAVEEVPDEMDASVQGSDRVIKRKGRTLLTDKSTRPKRQGQNNVQLEKLPQPSLKAQKELSVTNEEENLLKMKAAKGLSDEEFAFLKEYRRLEELEREKGIKFFECVGDPPATEAFLTGI